MSREKQIEEMAGFIYGLPMSTKDDCDFVAKLLIGEGYRKIPTTDWLTKGISQEQIEREKEDAFVEVAERLGYRKQNKWISIEERLPESEERVLVYINSKRYGKHLDTDRYLRDSDSWVRWGNHITHWMPLPEAPKMGGEA